MASLLAKAFPELEKAGAMYIDNWPIMPPMLAVFHPDMMAEFTQTTSLPKHPHLFAEFMPFTQLNDLITMSGQTWKMWRAIFNPAFSSKNLLSLMPAVLEEIDVFVDSLKQAAQSKQVIRLEDNAIKCTIDIMGRAILSVWRILPRYKLFLEKANLITAAFASTVKAALTSSTEPCTGRSLCYG